MGMMFRLLVFLAATASATLTTRQVDYSSLHCPSDSLSTLTTPTYGTDGAIFTVCSELLITASPLVVYNAILDFKSYQQWNTFITDVALPSNVSSTPGDLYMGTAMTFTSNGLIGDLNTTSAEILTLFDASGSSGYLINAWRYDDGVGGVSARAEHPNVLVDLGNGSTRYLSYETYYAGLSTGAIALLKGQLKDQFDAQAQDLKAYVESL
ncbi:uncharacterized protein GGS22DRAFT_64717 [Annulohypoxylon maeteangense]|uniref:uncharacterized protein n=1 Tax=Annulohypoxylon maeteangense TaxID=1927788 RepID=UPI0020075900|nr:uncharacterized protein GGS22DRAFT_64717 [Annulohypoxylon maeteangense]KAI0888915.1 hypothetical protein GGS22DRAFT_64717 [Annulohypoxylon maeteangense]